MCIRDRLEVVVPDLPLLALGSLLGVVEGPVDGRLGVKQLVGGKNVTNPLLSLENEERQ